VSSVAAPFFPPRRPAVVLIALWGVAGVTWLLVSAIVRLTPLAIEPVVAHTMTTAQWGLYVGWSLFNGYVEGYRGFQKGYVPRVVARAFWLGQHPRPLLLVLAPFFCSGLIYATRRRLITSWCLLVGIVLIVQLVRLLDQPWRGILDAGVVVGLAYGTAALLVAFTRVLAGAPIRVSPQVPDDA
jgi:hypothetical protein